MQPSQQAFPGKACKKKDEKEIFVYLITWKVENKRPRRRNVEVALKIPQEFTEYTEDLSNIPWKSNVK